MTEPDAEPINEKVEEDAEDEEDLYRYIGYVSNALYADDKWREHARQFLTQLGYDPDELEAQQAQEDKELRDEFARLKESARPSK